MSTVMTSTAGTPAYMVRDRHPQDRHALAACSCWHQPAGFTVRWRAQAPEAFEGQQVTEKVDMCAPRTHPACIFQGHALSSNLQVTALQRIHMLQTACMLTS